MRNLSAFFIVALLTACGTMSADRTETAKQQVAKATALGLKHTIAVTLRVSPHCMILKRCFRERRLRRSVQTMRRLPSTLQTPPRTRTREFL